MTKTLTSIARFLGDNLFPLAVLIATVVLLFSVARTPAAPQVILQMPGDLKGLAKLDEHAKVVAGDRATLWFSVYSAGLKAGWNQSAIDAANAAVDTVYGPFPSHP